MDFPVAALREIGALFFWFFLQKDLTLCCLCIILYFMRATGNSNKLQRLAYRQILAAYASIGMSAAEVNEAAKAIAGENAAPADWISAAQKVDCECPRCKGTKVVKVRTNQYGKCYYCGGKGAANYADIQRNYYYWEIRGQRIMDAAKANGHI